MEKQLSNPWMSFHIYYQGNLELLLLEAVHPIVEKLKDEDYISQWFYLRYWDGGPHLRLRVLPAMEVNKQDLQRTIEQRINAWLAWKPSRTILEEQTYARHAEILARQEGFKRLPNPMRPNNTIELATYEPEIDVYGNGLSLQASEAHFYQSSRVAIEVLNSSAGYERRAAIAQFLLMVTLAESKVAPENLALWIRSRWREWQMSSKNNQVPIRSAAPATGTNSLREQAKRLWFELRKPDALDPDDILGRWQQSVRTLREVQRARRVSTAVHATSPFLPDGGEGPEDAPELPLMLRCLHLFNNRLGLPGDTEGMLFVLACDVLEDAAATNRRQNDE